MCVRARVRACVCVRDVNKLDQPTNTTTSIDVHSTLQTNSSALHIKILLMDDKCIVC